MSRESDGRSSRGMGCTRRRVVRTTAAVGFCTTLGATAATAQESGGDLVREYGVGSTIGTSSPTIVDGTVYFGNQGNNLFAVDAESGDEPWSYGTPKAVRTGPTVAGDTVFVGSGSEFADTGTGGMHAVDVDSGEERWTFETSARVTSSPTVVDGVVYFGSDDDSV